MPESDRGPYGSRAASAAAAQAFGFTLLRLLATLVAAVLLAGCQAPQNQLSMFVGPSASSYVDPDGRMGIEEIVARRAELFRHTEGAAPNGGIAARDNAGFWLTFSVPYLGELVAQGWSAPLIVSVKEARLQHAELYLVSPSGIRHQVWDMRDDSRMSGEGFRYPVFVVEPRDLEGASLFLKISSASSMQGLVWLSDFQSFFGAYDTETMTLSILIGIFCALLVYILALGSFLRSGTNLFLAACIAATLLSVLSSNAMLHTIGLPFVADVWRGLPVASSLLITATFFGFLVSFLRLPVIFPQTARLCHLIIGALIVTAFLAMFDEQAGLNLIRHVRPYIGILTIPIALAAAFATGRSNPKRSIAFILAWLPAMLSGGIRLLLDVFPQMGGFPSADTARLLGFATSLALFSVLASLDIQRREQRLKAEISSTADRFRSLAEIGTDIFWEIDAAGRLSFFSGHMIGRAHFALEERFLDSLTAASSAEFVRPLRDSIAERHPFDDRRLRIAGGERDLWISVSGRPIKRPSSERHERRQAVERGQTGRSAAHRAVYRGLIRDVTEEVERESRRLVEQQMFALGQLAGSVAHEINNLLHPIVNLTKRLRSRNADVVDPESKRMMDLIDISSRQAASVVSELLQSTRGERWKEAGRPLSVAVEHSIEAIRPALPSGIRVDMVIEPCDTVVVKVGDILQIIGNLVSNAVHAMEGFGIITVSLSQTEDGARLCVSDDGAGMEESVRRRALQPFFSTKVDGQGTGVGLYIVQKIVRDYGGQIEIESGPGQGTTVTILIPAKKDDNAQL